MKVQILQKGINPSEDFEYLLLQKYITPSGLIILRIYLLQIFNPFGVHNSSNFLQIFNPYGVHHSSHYFATNIQPYGLMDASPLLLRL